MTANDSGAARARRRGGRAAVTLVSAVLVVSLALVASALASVQPKSGSYAGSTSQGNAVSFKVKSGKVKHPKFTIVAGPCRSTTTFSSSDKINSSGKFAIVTSVGKFKGKFVSDTKVKGTASVPANPGVGCPAKTVHYTARHR